LSIINYQLSIVKTHRVVVIATHETRPYSISNAVGVPSLFFFASPSTDRFREVSLHHDALFLPDSRPLINRLCKTADYDESAGAPAPCRWIMNPVASAIFAHSIGW